MKPQVRGAAARQPAIYVTEADHHRLSVLAGAVSETSPGATLLREELARAVVVGPKERPRAFVRLGSIVRYEDGATGRERTVQLVLPQEADIDQGRISVLSPVGAALFGLTAGKAFTWEPESGPARVLRVLEVDAAPQAA